ncbi:hypothetical protein [Winogradskyella sp.]|uniref:hypothetical protein n=1 Tax=Winogradskyella sp. TaxID=1883156 RepID=UPI002602D097|nr:hypothetical protein [Winogradskyella sp.]
MNESSNSIDLKKKINDLSLEDYVSKQIQIGAEINTLLLNEENINIQYLESLSVEFELNEVSNILQEANIQKSERISNLLVAMYNNSIDFANNNPDFKNFTSEEIENIIEAEYDKQLEQYNKSNSCIETYDRARYRCGRNLTIAVSVSAVVGIFTGGMGWGIGAMSAFAISALCLDDAMDDYNECMENE